MKYGTPIFEKKEFELLKRIISMAKYHKDKSYRASIEKLHKELDEAKVVDEKKMPADVIRFNSVVSIQTPWDVKRTYQVVTPEKSDLKKEKISVLAPMGLALFGYAEGDEFEWHFPMGVNTIKILEVEQSKTSEKIEEI